MVPSGPVGPSGPQFGVGQLEHRLGRVDDCRIVDTLRAVGTVAPLDRIGGDEISQPRCVQQVCIVTGSFPQVDKHACQCRKILNTSGIGLFLRMTPGIDQLRQEPGKSLFESFVTDGVREMPCGEESRIITVKSLA